IGNREPANLYTRPVNAPRINAIALKVPWLTPARPAGRPAGTPNDAFAGKDGKVYRRDEVGRWRVNDRGNWRPTPTPAPAPLLALRAPLRTLPRLPVRAPLPASVTLPASTPPPARTPPPAPPRSLPSGDLEGAFRARERARQGASLPIPPPAPPAREPARAPAPPAHEPLRSPARPPAPPMREPAPPSVLRPAPPP